MKAFRNAQNRLERSIASPEHDQSVLQQSRFWMRGISWALMGTTGFALGWLALARTEEIVTAPGTLEPIGSVKEIQMPVGGIADQILVKEGDRVKSGQTVMKLDTEGNVVTAFGAGMFIFPHKIYPDLDGNIWVVDQRDINEREKKLYPYADGKG